MPARRAARPIVAALAPVVGVAGGQRQAPPPRLTLKALRFDQLVGWNDDNAAAAMPALLKTCAVVIVRGSGRLFRSGRR